MNPYQIAMVGTQALSLLSGAGARASQAQTTIGMNNISLGYLQEQMEQLPELTQLQKETSRDKMINKMDTLGMGAGMQWDNVNLTMDSAMDSNKFANYGQLESRFDLITQQQRDKFSNQVESLGRQRDLEIAAAEGFQVAEESRLENQKKLLKMQNRQARKSNTLFKALFR